MSTKNITHQEEHQQPMPKLFSIIYEIHTALDRASNNSITLDNICSRFKFSLKEDVPTGGGQECESFSNDNKNVLDEINYALIRIRAINNKNDEIISRLQELV